MSLNPDILEYFFLIQNRHCEAFYFTLLCYVAYFLSIIFLEHYVMISLRA
jgi:hypothetical protein